MIDNIVDLYKILIKEADYQFIAYSFFDEYWIRPRMKFHSKSGSIAISKKLYKHLIKQIDKDTYVDIRLIYKLAKPSIREAKLNKIVSYDTLTK